MIFLRFSSLLQHPTAATTYTKTGLQPFTNYEIRLKAINDYATAVTDWIKITTKQAGMIPATLELKGALIWLFFAAPGPIDPLLMVGIGARYILLSWSPPVQPNGILTAYQIFVNNDLIASASNQRSKF